MSLYLLMEFAYAVRECARIKDANDKRITLEYWRAESAVHWWSRLQDAGFEVEQVGTVLIVYGMTK